MRYPRLPKASALVLALLAAAVTASATPPADGDAANSRRAELLATVASQAGGVDLAGRPGVDFIVVKGTDVGPFLDSLRHGSPAKVRTRAFVDGQLAVGGESAFATLRREAGIYQPASGSLFVVGTRDDDVVIEDIRLLEVEGTVFVLRDIHLQASAGAVEASRNLPVLLAATSKALAPPPQITSLSGVSSSAAGLANGRVSMSCGTTWNGRMVINDQAGVYPWTINGLYFTTTGSVSIGGKTVPTNSWSTTKIVANPTSTTSSVPVVATTLKVTAVTGSATYAVSTAPSIRTRVYGQCTHFVAAKRLAFGLQPSPSAYGGYSAITSSWVPRKGDQLQWSARHTAIITAVSGPVSSTGGYKTYSLTVGEQNADCRNSLKSYTTEFQTRTVNGVTTVTKFPKSSVTSLGSSTTYYR